MFKLYMGPKPALAVTHPELARQVLTRPKAVGRTCYKHSECVFLLARLFGVRKVFGILFTFFHDSLGAAIPFGQEFQKMDNDLVASKSISAPLNYTPEPAEMTFFCQKKRWKATVKSTKLS